MKRYLVVANQTLGGQQLTEAIRERAEAGEARFHVVVPNTRAKDLVRWPAAFGGAGGQTAVVLTPPDAGSAGSREEANRRARDRLEDALDLIGDAGAEADGEIGDPDPVAAVAQVLEHQEFDEILVSMLPSTVSRWLHLDLPSRLRREFKGPVTVIEAPG